MEIKTNKKEILDSLLIIQNFISTSTTLPLLSNILFEADNEYLYLMATDMDISAKVKCKLSKIEKEGKTTIPKKIIPLIKELPDAEISFIADKNDNIKIQCLKSSYKIPGLPADDFPVLQLDDKKLETMNISQKMLRDIINLTAYSALKDTAKRNLNGLFFKFEEKILEVVGTDAHRLAYVKKTMKEPVKTKFEYIIPLKTINEISKIITDDEKEITINFYPKLIEFKLENIEIVSRIIDENYPNYNQVIPKEFNMSAIVNKEELHSSLRRAVTISSDKAKIVSFKFEKNKLYINAQAQDEGEAFEEMDIKYDNEPIEVSYNAIYITEVLKAISQNEIEIKLISSMNPGLIKPVDDNDFVYIIMPIRK